MIIGDPGGITGTVSCPVPTGRDAEIACLSSVYVRGGRLSERLEADSIPATSTAAHACRKHSATVRASIARLRTHALTSVRAELAAAAAY